MWVATHRCYVFCMEGEEDRSSVFCAHEGEGEPPPQQQPPAQYGARGAVAVVGLH